MNEKRYPLWIYLDPKIATQIKKEAVKSETTVKSLIEEAVLYWYRHLKEGQLGELDSDETKKEIKEGTALMVEVLAKRRLEKKIRQTKMRYGGDK